MKAGSINEPQHICQLLPQCHVAPTGSGLPRSPGCVGQVSLLLHPGVKETALVQPVEQRARAVVLQPLILYTTNTV